MARQQDFTGKHVLITGAGSGIGRATAVAFAQRGAQLHLVDISEVGLHQTRTLTDKHRPGGELYVVDVSNADAMQNLADRIHHKVDALDVLINNAGIGSAGRFLETTLATWDKVIGINLKGVVHGCHVFLPAMVARGTGGHVVNVASMAAYIASPEMPVYAASKYAVLGFSEALRVDMHTHGIGVSAVCPGVINTAIVSATEYEGQMSLARERVIEFYKKRNYPPERVAEAIVRAVQKNIGVLPVSPESWALYYAKRFVPGVMDRALRVKLPFTKAE